METILEKIKKANGIYETRHWYFAVLNDLSRFTPDATPKVEDQVRI
jgi:hypothetical protein